LKFDTQVTKREASDATEWKRWVWRSIGDTFVNGAYFLQSGVADIDTNLDGSSFTETFAPYMTASAGALSCSIATAC
jgi:pectate lyase